MKENLGRTGIAVARGRFITGTCIFRSPSPLLLLGDYAVYMKVGAIVGHGDYYRNEKREVRNLSLSVPDVFHLFGRKRSPSNIPQVETREPPLLLIGKSIIDGYNDKKLHLTIGEFLCLIR